MISPQKQPTLPSPPPHRSDSLFDLDQLSILNHNQYPSLVDLPLDLLSLITRLLPTNDVLSCARVCRRLYSPAVHRLFAHPNILSTTTLDRFLVSLTTANQDAAQRSEAPALIRRLSLSLPLAELTSHQLERLAAQCPQLHSLNITDSASLHHHRGHSGPLVTLKLESLLSLTPQLKHLSLANIDQLDAPHLITHLAAHCPQLASLALSACHVGDAMSWRSSVLALRRLAPNLESLAIDVGGRRSAVGDGLTVVLRDLQCSGLRALSLAGFNAAGLPHDGSSADLFAALLTRLPALVKLRLDRIVWENPGADWVQEGIIGAWKVSEGKRGQRRTVVLSNVDRVKSEVTQRIEQACDGVVVEVEVIR